MHNSPGQQRRSNRVVISQKKHFSVQEYETKMLWRMRWFLVTPLTTTYLVSILTGIIGFATTRDGHYMFFVLPAFLAPFIHYLVPMDKKRYLLSLSKIEVRAYNKVTKQPNNPRKLP